MARITTTAQSRILRLIDKWGAWTVDNNGERRTCRNLVEDGRIVETTPDRYVKKETT